jgi:hypothetical protein
MATSGPPTWLGVVVLSVMVAAAGEVALDRDGELGEVGSFDLEAATAVCNADPTG